MASTAPSDADGISAGGVHGAEGRQQLRRAVAVSAPNYDTAVRPSPSPSRTTCAELARQREDARAQFDGSKETDANVLMRQHQRREHRG